MTITRTPLKDCLVLVPNRFYDERGYFSETYNKALFDQYIGKQIDFVQDNESCSKKGVLRGLHFQIKKHAQAKLIRVTKGAVLDVCVDLRPDSPSYLNHFSTIISYENKKQLFVPRGFAHGFVVLEDDTVFNYKCDNYYNKSAERGIIYKDPTLAIDWQLSGHELIVSEKDKNLPTLETYLNS